MESVHKIINAITKQPLKLDFIYQGFIIPFCKCSGPFQGIKCENHVNCPYCDDNKCNMDGICTKCIPGRTGKYCEKIDCGNLDICNDNGK